MDRRNFIKSSGVSALSAVTVGAAAESLAAGKPSTFVLVHGTWLGGWIWHDVAEKLRALGHQVYTPTLTGMGERHHLSNPEVGLETHIQDITAVIDYEELKDVILIGHSFSGAALTGAADRRRSAIKHIAFFDALIPHAGRMSAVEKNPDGSDNEKLAKKRALLKDGYQMVFWDSYPIKMMVGDDYPEIQAKLRRIVSPAPIKGWTDELVLKNGGWEGLPRTCYRAMSQAFAPSSPKMWHVATQPGWQLIELPVGRMGMLTQPDIVAAAFAKLAA